MVKLLLSVKAELENVTDLVPATDDFEFFFQVQCNSCHETHPKYVGMNMQEEHEVSGGKNATAHFVWRCGMCKRESTAKFDTTYGLRPYKAENGQFGPLLIIECRGLEFVGFDMTRGTWKCKGADSGTVFSDVDLSDGDWTDYDEKSAQPVGISELDSKWTRA
ncbi:hypothetical protein BD626DRAFT_505919 [Schizophyllum amplum]|uniref:DUF866-domain-containing protein n=1 Tax=Schizophyllum amplum TaxID=97359 RepID=A0A550C652_9AGAR|nr:hypothetical protein BD626DRAFT_505919 [Auriculariopsis ampla]